MMFGGGMILVWLIPIIGGYFLVKYLVEQNKNNPNEDKVDPLTILKRRYANGEMTRQEFNERKKIIINV
ncbi:MAG: SHOCT domain-containing protein [Actinobacteria bacterium]|nr:SHOCT domain-containing protein [Actinomycetota bacterium]